MHVVPRGNHGIGKGHGLIPVPQRYTLFPPGMGVHAVTVLPFMGKEGEGIIQVTPESEGQETGTWRTRRRHRETRLSG